MNIGPINHVPAIGVDLFFVLSGFLITGVLLRARERSNYFTNFYARRSLRIAPLYFAFIVFLFIASGRLPALAFDSHKSHFWVFALYLQNIYYRSLEAIGPRAVNITWSLAIEEQFYMVWPLIVRRLSLRGITVVASVLILIAPLARLILPLYGWDPYVNPLSRMDALAMGSLLSLWMFSARPSASRVRTIAMSLLGGALSLEILCQLIGWNRIMSRTFLPVIFTGCVALAMSWEPFASVLSIAPLRLSGKYSYCLYLVHTVVALLIYQHMPGMDMTTKLLRTLLIIVACYAVAIVSWNVYEQPILKLKKYFENGKDQKDRDLAQVSPVVSDVA